LLKNLDFQEWNNTSERPSISSTLSFRFIFYLKTVIKTGKRIWGRRSLAHR